MTSITRTDIFEIFAEVLGLSAEEISDESSPENIPGWDSIKSMEILTLLEERLHVEFSAEEIGEMASVGATIRVLNLHGISI